MNASKCGRKTLFCEIYDLRYTIYESLFGKKASRLLPQYLLYHALKIVYRKL
jgi:hypothetical protein